MNETKYRNPWIAGILTALGGGVGFLYLGKWRWAIAYSTLLYVELFWLSANGLPLLPLAMWIFILLLIIIFFIPIIIAVLISCRAQPEPLRNFQRWYFYIFFYLFTTLLGQYTTQDYTQNLQDRNFHIPTNSMANTILTDDYLTADKKAYQHDMPKRGEVIIFKYPPNPTEKYIRRVIGLPGDVVKIKENKVWVNDTLLEESYLSPDCNKNGDGDYPEFQVPTQSYFVLGDNRDNSLDSRHWGYVPKANIVARAEYIWLSYDASKGFGLDALRLKRIGTKVQ